MSKHRSPSKQPAQEISDGPSVVRPRVQARSKDGVVTIFATEGIVTVRLGDVTSLVGELIAAAAMVSTGQNFPFGDKPVDH